MEELKSELSAIERKIQLKLKAPEQATQTNEAERKITVETPTDENRQQPIIIPPPKPIASGLKM